MLATLRAILVAINFVVSTTLLGGCLLIALILRLKDRPGMPADWVPRWWGKTHIWLSGVRIIEHGVENKQGGGIVFVANHLGNFDVFALAARLSWMKFVAKAELFRVPILGQAMNQAGMVPLERANRKAAFGAYSVATKRLQMGASIAVYPEGTRGEAYPLRPFKKGPFVMAIQAQAPIVPVLIHGALEVQRKGELKVYPGTMHMHYLPPIPTAGLDYDQREALARKAYEAMAECLLKEYGIASPPFRGA
jgi:1-acyl-sn-glycerol-3-phosphate acyltransferase